MLIAFLSQCHNFPFPNGVTQQLYNAAMADAIYTYSSLMNYSSPLGTNWATMSMAYCFDFVNYPIPCIG